MKAIGNNAKLTIAGQEMNISDHITIAHAPMTDSLINGFCEMISEARIEFRKTGKKDGICTIPEWTKDGLVNHSISFLCNPDDRFVLLMLDGKTKKIGIRENNKEEIRNAICHLFFDGKFPRPADHPLNDATFRGLLDSLAAMGRDELVPSGIYADRLEELGHPKWAKAAFELVTPPPKDFGRRLVSQCLAYEVLGDALWRGCGISIDVHWRDGWLVQFIRMLQDYCIREYGSFSGRSYFIDFRSEELWGSYRPLFGLFPID